MELSSLDEREDNHHLKPVNNITSGSRVEKQEIPFQKLFDQNAILKSGLTEKHC